MPNTREKLIELPVADAILILKEELKQRTDGYTTYLANGGKGDPVEEVNLDALSMAISALEQKKWIPVTERLPKGNLPGEISENVIVRTTDGEVTTGWLDALGSDKWWLVIGTDDSHTCWGLGYVTHWMPLPEAPKGEK